MRIHFSRDLLGYVMFSIVVSYWIYGTIVPTKLILIPYFQMGLVRVHALVMYAFFSSFTLASLIRATFYHPGRTNNGSSDDSEALNSDWTFCDKCNKRRPPRAHHCRRCGHCVARMDHHCPWINNCVGQDNHFAFMQLIFYTIGLSVSAFVFCLVKSYVLPPCPPQFCDKESFFFIHERGLFITSYVLSLLMAIFMTMLSIGQHLSIALDVTTVEAIANGGFLNSLFLKPERPIRYRYEDLCGTRWIILWLLPCRNRNPLIHKDYSQSIV